MSRENDSRYFVDGDRIVVPANPLDRKDESVLVFDPKFVGPTSYIGSGRELFQRGLDIPTAENQLAFVHAAYCGPRDFRDHPNIHNFRYNLEHEGSLWVPTVNSPTDKGIYVFRDRKMRGKITGMEVVLGDSVDRNLFPGVMAGRNDRVRLVNDSAYPRGSVEYLGDEDRGYVLATYGHHGPDLLNEVSDRIGYPINFVFPEIGMGVSSIDLSDLDSFPRGIFLDGSNPDGSQDITGIIYGLKNLRG